MIDGKPAAQWFQETANRQKQNNRFANYQEVKPGPLTSGPPKADATDEDAKFMAQVEKVQNAARLLKQLEKDFAEMQKKMPRNQPVKMPPIRLEEYNPNPAKGGPEIAGAMGTLSKEWMRYPYPVAPRAPTTPPPPRPPYTPKYYEERTMTYLQGIAPFVNQFAKEAGCDPRGLMLALADEHKDVYSHGLRKEIQQRGQDLAAFIHPGILTAINLKLLGRTPDIGPSNINVSTGQRMVKKLGYTDRLAPTTRYIQTFQGTAEIGAQYMKEIQDQIAPLLKAYKDPNERAAHLCQFWRQGVTERLKHIQKHGASGLGSHGMEQLNERLADIDSTLQ